MPKIGKQRRVSKNVDADRWRRRAEAYERLVHMIQRASDYTNTDGGSAYGDDHPLRRLHEALLILDEHKVVEINRDLHGVDPMALWKAIEQWKQAADSLEAPESPWGPPITSEQAEAEWPGPLTGDKDE